MKTSTLILVATAAILAASVSGIAIQQKQERASAVAREIFASDCKSYLAGIDTQMGLREASTKRIDDCMSRGAISQADLAARIDAIMHPPGIKY